MSKSIAIVVPCHNEVGNIRVLFDRVQAALAERIAFRIVFVDDGSTDGTLDEVRALADESDHVGYIQLSRNFGHQFALKAGLDHVDADCVIMMDADLQHPPELIGAMLDKWEEGYDVVYTVRQDDEGVSWFKRITSIGFYRLLNRLGAVEMEPGAADFRLIDRKVLKVFKSDINEYYLFIRGLTAWVGFNQFALSYVPADRHAGETKYSLSRMIGFAINGITSFSILPLRISVVLGLVISMLAGLYGLYVVAMWAFTDAVVQGWTSVIISVLFIGGIQMLMLGIIGEYIGKTFYEVKRRPRYIIKSSKL